MPGYLTQPISGASGIAVAPTGNITATNVQSAFTQVDQSVTTVSNAVSTKEKSIPLQNTAPTSPSVSDLWVDNTIPTFPVLKVYDGTAWKSLGSIGTDALFFLMGA